MVYHFLQFYLILLGFFIFFIYFIHFLLDLLVYSVAKYFNLLYLLINQFLLAKNDLIQLQTGLLKLISLISFRL